MALEEEKLASLKRLQELQLKVLRKRSQHNRLQVERGKLVELSKWTRRKNWGEHEHRMRLLALETDLTLAQERSKQLDMDYRLEIELPARLEVEMINRVSEAIVARVERETRADLDKELVVGRALLASETSGRLREAQSSRRLATAYGEWCKARLIDLMAGLLLSKVATCFELDTQFRFKLERPLLLQVYSHYYRHEHHSHRRRRRLNCGRQPIDHKSWPSERNNRSFGQE